MKKKLLILILVIAVIYTLFKMFLSSSVTNTFPFSQADNIELIFYKEAQQGGSNLKSISKIPLKKKVQLNANEKKELFEILYKENCFVEYQAACYDPRHALVFTTQNDTIGIIEMCLECSQSRVTDRIKSPMMCDEMIIKLDKYFKSKE